MKVKSFTLREPGLLDECDRQGAVKVRRRDRRTYTIRADGGPDQITAVPDFRGRLAKLFPKQIPAAQSRLVDKLLASE